MKTSPLLFFLAMLLFLSGCSSNEQNEEQQSSEIVNPVLAGDRPDPTVVKIGDTYWASATSNEWSPLFPIFKSGDLIHWELVTYVFPEGAPDWAINNFWAPELSYDKHQGKVYIYYTARDKKSNRLSVAVASADSPEGPYTDHGPLVAQELGSIDAYEVRDRDGSLYLTWKEDGNSQGKPTPMWAQRINEERTELIGDRYELFRNDEPWEQFLVEGISIFRKNDYFYATYSAGACCNKECNYKTGVARAKKLLGPWEKYDQNPILADTESWHCPGHGTVVTKNQDHYFLYHAYSEQGDVYVGRSGVLQKMEWTEEGWPVFPEGAEYNRTTESVNFSDDFQPDLEPIWQWRVTQDIKYKTGNQGLKLGASRENEDIGTLLVQPTKSPDYQITTTVNLAESSSDAKAGIALIGGEDNGFGAPVAAIGISVGQETVEVWETANKETQRMGQASIGQSDGPIDLKMEVREGHLLTFSYRNDKEWKILAENVDAEPRVPWGMGFRFGLVAKGPANQVVNFEKFELRNRQL